MFEGSRQAYSVGLANLSVVRDHVRSHRSTLSSLVWTLEQAVELSVLPLCAALGASFAIRTGGGGEVADRVGAAGAEAGAGAGAGVRTGAATSGKGTDMGTKISPDDTTGKVSSAVSGVILEAPPGGATCLRARRGPF